LEIKMTLASTKLQKGFTLVELAIVLVIIGLIVSGVLVGQDLIKAAELRATVRQVQDFQVGVNTFIGKYSGIPGDTDADKYGLCDGEIDVTGCSSAVAAAATTGCDGEANLGDGDGKVEDNAGGKTKYNGEISCFWSELTTPGKELIKGVYDGFTIAAGTGAANDAVTTNMPKLRFGSSGWGVFTDGTYNYFTTGVTGSSGTDEYLTSVVLVPIEAFNIDSKIDDGVPTAGDVQSRGASLTTAADADMAASTNAGVSTTVCNNTTPTPNEYQFTAIAAQCNLRFKMQTF
jgi:prepilin-type N-terminal cleavage/methylation domain-containing protein